ncbi:MAG: fimbrillin family protein [Tannerellaceae bacterium]|jgi:hypothetical protein|nr:fimbrillin family protein [Tannerellaceae bacterium]
MNKANFLKGFFPLTATALLWGGCSDDKFDSDNSATGKQIAFRLQSNIPSSRATGTTLDYVNAFVVNAQVYGSDDDTKGSWQREKLFDAQTVARIEGQANTFDYNPKRYYPDAANVAYYSAYSPVTKNITTGFKGSTSNQITYNVLQPDGVYGNTTQEDLLVAYTKVEGVVQENDNAPVYRAGFETPVLLNFKHALSRVFVKASNWNNDIVVIKSLSLHNLHGEGTLDIDDTGGWNENDKVNINEGYMDVASSKNVNDYKILWNSTDSPEKIYEYVLPASGVSVAGMTGNTPKYIVSKEQGMLVLPQTTINNDDLGKVDSGDFYVKVTYSIGNSGEEKSKMAAFPDLNQISGKGLTFEFGKQYALNISFSGMTISFDIKVENWDEQSEENPQAATTVVFNDNKPVNASKTLVPNEIADHVSSKFIYDQSIEETTGTDVIGKKAPILPGWTFLGYFDELDGTQYFKLNVDKLALASANESFDGTNWDKTGPACTLYAHWEPTSDEIAIDVTTNGGAVGQEAGSNKASIAWTFDQKLPDIAWTTKPSKTGYDFTGLFITANGGDPIYDADGHTSVMYNTVDQYGEKGSETLYARYAAKKFTVTIDLMGGQYDNKGGHVTFTQEYNKATGNDGTALVFDITTEYTKFTRSGYTFKGFSSASEATTTDVLKDNSGWKWQDTYGATSWTATSDNTTLYVVWEVIP